MSFNNKVILVTGGSSGIGAATAVSFAREGAKVAIVGRNETKLRSVAAEIEKNGNKCLVIKADVANDDDARRIVQETVDTFGGIDVLVNNAGTNKFGSVLDGKLMDAYDSIMSVNLRAAMNLTSLAAPHIVKTKGSIINISSTGSQLVPALPQFIPYCVSKAALEHFTKGAARELAPSGVRVNAIRPGPVRTDMIENTGFPGTWDIFKAGTALNRVGEPEEIAYIALFLASDKAKSITGSVYTSDNGYLLKN